MLEVAGESRMRDKLARGCVLDVPDGAQSRRKRSGGVRGK